MTQLTDRWYLSTDSKQLVILSLVGWTAVAVFDFLLALSEGIPRSVGVDEPLSSWFLYEVSSALSMPSGYIQIVTPLLVLLVSRSLLRYRFVEAVVVTAVVTFPFRFVRELAYAGQRLIRNPEYFDQPVYIYLLDETLLAARESITDPLGMILITALPFAVGLYLLRRSGHSIDLPESETASVGETH